MISLLRRRVRDEYMQGQILSCAKNNSKNTFFYPENTRKTDEKLDQTKIIYKHRRSRGIMIPKKEVLPEEKTSREASQSEREGGMFVGGGVFRFVRQCRCIPSQSSTFC